MDSQCGLLYLKGMPQLPGNSVSQSPLFSTVEALTLEEIKVLFVPENMKLT